MTIDVWNQIAAGYVNYPEQFRSMFPMLVTVVKEELKEPLDGTRPISSLTLFTRNPVLYKMRGDTLTDQLLCEETHMTSMDVPTQLLLSARLE